MHGQVYFLLRAGHSTHFRAAEETGKKGPACREGLGATGEMSGRIHSPAGVIGESEEVDGGRVTLQFKGSHNLLEVPFFPKADLPNLDIWGEAA